MNCKRTLLPLAVVLIAGVAGGILRARELVGNYDDVSGLYNASAVTWLLIGLSAAAVLFCLIVSLRKGNSGQDFMTLYRTDATGAVLGMFSGLLIAAAGFYRILSFFRSGTLSWFLVGILTVIAGVAMIALTVARKRGEVPDMTRLGAVVIVYFGCFILIQVFLEHPVEPVLFVFAYDLLAICAAVLALCGTVGQLFKYRRAFHSLFGSLLAVYFLITSGLGRFLTYFHTGSFAFVRQVDFRLAVYLGLLPFCLSVAASLLQHAEKETKEGEGEAASGAGEDIDV